MSMLFFLFYPSSSISQEIESSNDIVGKWQYITTNFFDKNYDFSSDVIFEFGNGVFKYYSNGIGCNNRKIEFIDGSYVLVDNVLELKDNSNWCPGVSHSFPVYKIVFLNKNLFYSVSREGRNSKKVYTYFKRKL